MQAVEQEVGIDLHAQRLQLRLARQRARLGRAPLRLARRLDRQGGVVQSGREQVEQHAHAEQQRQVAVEPLLQARQQFCRCTSAEAVSQAPPTSTRLHAAAATPKVIARPCQLARPAAAGCRRCTTAKGRRKRTPGTPAPARRCVPPGHAARRPHARTPAGPAMGIQASRYTDEPAGRFQTADAWRFSS